MSSKLRRPQHSPREEVEEPAAKTAADMIAVAKAIKRNEYTGNCDDWPKGRQERGDIQRRHRHVDQEPARAPGEEP